MSPALTDRPDIAEKLPHTCIGKQQGDVCAWPRESGWNSAQKQPKCTAPRHLSLHTHTTWNGETDLIRQDAHEGIDFRHQGGATCKFSGQFTVELVCTKNRKFYLRNLAKSIVLTQVKWLKHQTENAARLPPLLWTVVNQIEVDFRRFLVLLVDLSEPDP